MTSPVAVIREAKLADADAMLSIYKYYVENSWISFEEEVPGLSNFTARVAKYVSGWACLVAEQDGRVVGYAYASPHRERPAYRWSTETTIYLQDGIQRKGIGRNMYEELLQRLRVKGYCNAFAGVALPNEASVGLHQAVGFKPIGTFPRVGFKFGQWRDVAWFHKPLAATPPSIATGLAQSAA
jgi:phosphinothricin acetyltransferase